MNDMLWQKVVRSLYFDVCDYPGRILKEKSAERKKYIKHWKIIQSEKF